MTPARLRTARLVARVVGAASLALSVVAPAQPAIDYAREERWAQEIVPALVIGDAVYLRTASRERVLALLTLPPGSSKGGVIVVHGLGVHPDWGLNGGLRAGLADAGFTTLSVQMPVLPAGASRDDYAVAMPQASERIAAASAFLRERGVGTIAIVSHSLGATMVDNYLARGNGARIDAWVAVGMLVEFSVLPRMPVLDVVAGDDFREVVASLPARNASKAKDGCSGGVKIAGTDHYFENRQKELVAAVAAFLDRAFAGDCRAR